MSSGKIYTKAEQVKFWLDEAAFWCKLARKAWHEALRKEKEAKRWKRRAKDFIKEVRWYRDNANHVQDLSNAKNTKRKRR